MYIGVGVEEGVTQLVVPGTSTTTFIGVPRVFALPFMVLED